MGWSLGEYTPTNPAGDRSPQEGTWALLQPVGRPARRVWVRSINRAAQTAVVSAARHGRSETVPLGHLRGGEQ